MTFRRTNAQIVILIVILMMSVMLPADLGGAVSCTNEIVFRDGFAPMRSTPLRFPRGWNRLGFGRFFDYAFGKSNYRSPVEISGFDGNSSFIEIHDNLTKRQVQSYPMLEAFPSVSLYIEEKSRRLFRVEYHSRRLSFKEMQFHVDKMREIVDSDFAMRMESVKSSGDQEGISSVFGATNLLLEAEDACFKACLTALQSSSSTWTVSVSVTSKRVLNHLCGQSTPTSDFNEDVRVDDL